ncbi:MAG TPA: PAS domain S-box protein [Candidatus Kryptonia bacterium]|nr:PAS domain S-box protein [Candidatus Kryptonia bacterium]
MSNPLGDFEPHTVLRTRAAHSAVRYLVALAFTACALALKEMLGPAIVPSAFLTAYAAVLGSALVGGLGPGLLATTLSAIADTYLFLPRFDPHTPLRIALFVLTAGAISWVAARTRISRHQLADAERRYRRLFDSDLLGILFWKSDGRITEANDQLLDMVGYTRAELMAGILRWTDLTPPEYAPLDAMRLAEVQAAGVVTPFEKEYIRKDGSRIPIAIGATSFNAGGDEGVAFVLDISERKRAEAALRAVNAELEQRVAERTAELRASEERYRQVSELTSDFAYSMLVHPDGTSSFEWSAGAFDRIIGFAPKEVGMSELLSLIHPDDTEIVLERIRRLLLGESNVREFRVLSRSGEVRWLRDYARPVWDEQQQRVVRIVGAAQDISDRKQADIALRASEERFQRAFLETAHGMALVGLNGVPFQVNRALCDMLGYTETELLGLSSEALTYPDDLPADRLCAQRLLAGEARSCQFEKRYIHKRGHIVWASLSVSLVRRIDGRPLHFVSQVEDITDRRRLYEQLRDSEERFANGFKYAPIGMGLVGIDGVVLQVNQALCDMLGYSEQELLAMRSWEVTHPDDLKDTIEQMYQMVTGVTDTWHLARRYIHKDGHTVWGSSSTSMVRDAHGNPLYVISQVQDITERKRAEEALRESEERYALAVAGANDGLWDWDIAAGEVYLSPRLKAILGVRDGEIGSNPAEWLNRVHPEDLERAVATLMAHLSGDTAHCECEYRLRHANGTYRWVVSRGLAIRDSSGAPCRMAGSLTDVTERRQADEALRASEERFSNAFTYAPIGMALVALDGRAFQVNRALCKMLGYDEAELLGKTVGEITHPDDVASAYEQVARLLRGEVDSYQIEKRYLHKQGHVVIALLSASLVRDAQGQPLHVITQVEDITARKATESALHASEIRFQNAFRHASVGMALVSSDGRPLQINPALCKMLGYSEAELLPKPVSEVMHPDDWPAAQRDLQRLITGEATTYEAERRYLHKSGAVVWTQMSVSLVRDEDGRPLHTVSQLHDITAARQATEALRASEERFALAVAAAREGIWDLNVRASALYMSPQCQRLLGRADDEAPPPSSEWLSALHPDDYERAGASLARIISGQIDHFELELRLKHRDRSYRWALARGVVVRAADGSPCRIVGSLSDITEQKEVSEILAALNADLDVGAVFASVAMRLRSLARCDGIGIVLFDHDQEWGSVLALDRPLDALRPGARVRIADSPSAPEVLAGRPHIVPDLETEVRFPIAREIYDGGGRSALSLPLLGGERPFGMLNLVWKRSGAASTAPLPALQQIADALALALEKHRLFEQVRAGHEQLQTLSHELMRVQETERRHLATELHDEIGQTLTGIKLMLDTLDRSPSSTASARLAQVQSLVNDLVTQVRNLSLDLRPGMLDDLGLLPALLWLFGRYSNQTKVEVAFEHRGLERRFLPEVETAAFRIVQEALTNVARHAAVASARVVAIAMDATLVVEVVDDGRGFDPAGEHATGRFAGIAGMRERASLLGGQLDIEAAPGAGVYLRAELPLRCASQRSIDEREDSRRG